VKTDSIINGGGGVTEANTIRYNTVDLCALQADEMASLI